MYALVDCNNFYASCERVFRPELNGKPIVVLSNNDGCAIARSNEAKALGIPMGAPAFQFKELFEKHKVEVFSANFPLYGDMSHRVMSILETYSPEIEVYSIDEAFLRFSGFDHYDLIAYGQEIRKKVFQWTGIPITVGFAPTKALAKMANRIAKKYPERTQNVYAMDSEEKRIKALKWTAIGDVWGIGRQHQQRLDKMGIKTAFDFVQLGDDWVKKHLSIVGLRLKRELQGTAVLQLESPEDRKAIAVTRSFDTNYSELAPLKERVSTFAFACSEKLRKQHSNSSSLTVFAYTNGHRRDLPQYGKKFRIRLPFPTNSGMELSKFALKALEQVYREGYAFKKAGVIVEDFTPDSQPQLGCFSNRDQRQIPLMQAVDKLNFLYGKKVRLASHDPGKVWKMRQEKLSPSYSTDLRDIITIHL
ncbi:Y-family DNA polymerase [Algoriphagus vanfongensis]|uniref:Y-family DNA polymerase n=1 Tax=Algoriphagus vanfongensis TaxID=426371 RepID=UPI0003FA48FF|nr:Y-family DNA polymerase [Algoriphagus vanfongensis]